MGQLHIPSVLRAAASLFLISLLAPIAQNALKSPAVDRGSADPLQPVEECFSWTDLLARLPSGHAKQGQGNRFLTWSNGAKCANTAKILCVWSTQTRRGQRPCCWWLKLHLKGNNYAQCLTHLLPTPGVAHRLLGTHARHFP